MCGIIWLMLEQTAERWFPWRMPPAIWQAALHTRDGLERSIKVGEHTETLLYGDWIGMLSNAKQGS